MTPPAATAPTLPRSRLGATGPEVFPIALGCMGMSGMYGAADEAEAIATIHEAIELGVTMLDTGDFYGTGHNERLIGRALAGRRDRVVLSVKFGALRAPGGGWGGVDARPAAVKNFAAYSLDRLGVDHLDIYRPARLDPAVPIEDTIGAIGDLVDQGYVRHVGLSEVGPQTIRRAHAVRPIVDVQLEYALVTRGPEARIFPVLDELGIGATLYGVLSRGLLTGRRPGVADVRGHLPRFAAAHHDRNQRVVGALAEFAADHDLTAAQLAIAWVRAKVPRFVPVIGARTRGQLRDALGALARPLSAAEVAALEALVPADAIAGDRYAAPQMAALDSERG